MITLSKSGNAVKFTFDENDHYLQNGTIEVPVNSLALIMDDSDMVTFRKSASNDIFVSANYAEFGMSKAELEAWYKTYMVGSSGGGGGTGGTTPEEVQEMIDASLIPYSTTSEVDSMIDESVSGKADSSAVDAINDTVTAHTADTTIHVTANEKAAWDNKSDFSGDYNDLANKPIIPTVPTSNTAFTNDAGYITSSALDGYATEDYVTASTSTKLDVSTFETYSGNVETELDGKQPIGDYVTGSQMSAFTYDKQTIDEKIAEGGIFDPTQYYTTAQTYSKTETNSLLDEKLDATAYTPTDLSNYDTKSEVNTKIEQATSGKVDTSTFNVYSGNVASALDGKVDDAEIADMATKTWVGNQGYLTEHQDISGKLDVSAFTAYSGAVDTTINSKASQASVDALNGVVTAHTTNTEIHVTSTEKNAWNNKSDFSGDYNDLVNKPTIPTVPTNVSDFTNDASYVTSTAVTQSINEAVSGKADSADIVDITGFALQNSDTLIMTREKNGSTIAPLTVVKAGSGLTISTDAMANKAFDVDTNTIQEKLVSGTNIKTINNESLLGSGNIDIQGGGGMTEDDELLLSTALTDLNDRKIDASEVKSNYQKKGDYVTTSTLNARLAEYETALDEQNVEEVTAYALNELNERLIALETAVQALQALHNNE